MSRFPLPQRVDRHPVLPDDWSPSDETELAAGLAANFDNERRQYFPIGGGTGDAGRATATAETARLHTSQMHRVIDYPARDMTITVESGITLAALADVLRQERQRLPIDLPDAHQATIGGAIAANASGSTRYGYGTFRDYLIGISAVDGQGRLFHAGGRVVKNVAGYDLCKMLVGSQGTLAVISTVTLKLRPAFEKRALVLAAFSPTQAVEPVLATLNASQTRPVLIDLFNPLGASHLLSQGVSGFAANQIPLFIGFEGGVAEVDWQISQVQQELQPHQPANIQVVSEVECSQTFQTLIDFQRHPDSPVTFRASLPRSASAAFLQAAAEQGIAAQAYAGNGSIWGHLPQSCSSVPEANRLVTQLREFAGRLQGSLVVEQCRSDWSGELDLTGLSGKQRELMSGIKQALDPAGLLSPGCLF